MNLPLNTLIFSMGYRDIKTAYMCTYKSPEVIEVVAPGSIINFDIPIVVVVMYGAKMMSTTSKVVNHL